MLNLMPPLAAAHLCFAVPATVTPKGGAAVVTTALRFVDQHAPSVGDLTTSAAAMVDLRDTISLPRTALPTLAVGSLLEADFGDGLRVYRIDRIDARYPDEWRVIVS